MEFFAFVATFLIIFGIYSYKKLTNAYKHIPGPPTVPLLGNVLLFWGKSKAEFLNIVFECSRKYRPFWRLMLTPLSQNIILEDPKDVEILLSSQKLISKSVEYDFLKVWLNEGLLLSTGKKWFSRRKVITPTFHFKILEQFVEVFDRQSDVFVACLEKYKDQGLFDVFPLVANCALDIICETSMGVKVNAQTDKDSIYVNAVKDITNILNYRFFDYSKRNQILYRFSNSYKKEKSGLEILHNFTDKVIRSRREELIRRQENEATGKIIEDDEEGIGAKKRVAFLDLLLQTTIDGKPLSDLDIREEVDTFMFEGHDTTTSAIAFALHELSRNPEIQAKCFDEIRQVIGDDLKKPFTLRDLNDLSYLELVIKETLRLYPSVPFVARKMIEDTEVNGKIIPKNSTAIVGIILMGRNPEYHKDPEKFNPERFLDKRESESSYPFLNVPFSAGPRNCIGQKFAMYEMKSTISKILRNYELFATKNAPDPILVFEIILRSENGVQICLKKRQY